MCNGLVLSTLLFVAYYRMKPTGSPMHVIHLLIYNSNLSQAHIEQESLCNYVGIFTDY